MSEPITSETKVEWIKVHAWCLLCCHGGGGGEMIAHKQNVGTGFVTLDAYSETPQIKHSCNKCKHTEFYSRNYPYTTMRDVPIASDGLTQPPPI